MAYPGGVNFQPTQPTLGMQPIHQTSTVQNHPLGMVVTAKDVTYGEGRFIYLKGVASTAQGDLACYDSNAGTTVRSVIGGTGSSGPCGVAASANVASQYGWYQVEGSTPVKAGTVLANTAAYLSATAGQVDDAVSGGNLVDGLFVKAADSGGYATCQLDHPSTSGDVDSGTNSGDVTVAAVGSTPSANGASLSGQVLTLQPADGSSPGVVSTGAQTIAGAKTFSGAISASNLSGTNTGDVTLAAAGSTPSANGASLSGQVLTLQPASSTLPGVVTAAAQTFAGKKTFSSGAVLSSQSLAPTNGGSVTPNANAGNVVLVTLNTGVATYTINAPSNGDVSQVLTFSVVNVSGGVSTATWDAAYKKVWTDPADNFYGGISFVYNGSVWIQVGASVADVAV